MMTRGFLPLLAIVAAGGIAALAGGTDGFRVVTSAGGNCPSNAKSGGMTSSFSVYWGSRRAREDVRACWFHALGS